MKKYNVIGIHATDRLKHAGRIQKVLTKYGRHIGTRLGIHDSCDNSPNGLIVVEVDNALYMDLKKELSEIDGLEVKSMRF